MADSDEHAPLCSSMQERLLEEQNSKKKRGRYSIGLICVIAMLERFVFHCCLHSLRMLLKENFCFADNDIELVIVPMIFDGAAVFLFVFGGVLADGVVSLGTTGCIIVGGIIYLIGAAVMLVPVSLNTPICHVNTVSHGDRTAFFTGLFIVALGSGIYRVNVTVFCGKQASHFYPGSGIKTAYALFYWFTNVGSILSTAVVIIIGINLPPNTLILFLADIIAMVLSLVTLYVGLVKVFAKEDVSQNVSLIQTFKTLCTVCSAKCPCCIFLIHRIPSGHDVSFIASLQRSREDRDGSRQTAKQVVVLGILFATFIMFWTVYSQMVSSYTSQAEKMIGLTKSFEYGWTVVVTVYDDGFVLILIPLVYFGLYKGLEKCGFREIPMLTRMGIGILMMMLSVIVAGIVETIRINRGLNKQHLSVFALLPQTMLVATGEVFATITGMEFAFTQSPVGLEGTVMGVYYCSWGFASFLGTGLVKLVNAGTYKWYPADINEGHLYCYMFLLAGLVAVSLAIFIFIAKKYKYTSRSRSGDTRELSVSGRYLQI